MCKCRMIQDELMIYDPATGEPRPYPSHAAQYRGVPWSCRMVV